MKSIKRIIWSVLKRLSEYNNYLYNLIEVKGRLYPGVYVKISKDSIFLLDSHSVVKRGTIIRAKNDSKIIIGSCTSINENNNIRSDSSIIQIGNNCMIAQFVSIISSGYNFDDPSVPIQKQGSSVKKDIIIGNDVWIGSGAVILPGVNIGDGVVIGAGSVVTNNVKAFSVVAGNPARIISSRMK